MNIKDLNKNNFLLRKDFKEGDELFHINNKCGEITFEKVVVIGANLCDTKILVEKFDKSFVCISKYDLYYTAEDALEKLESDLEYFHKMCTSTRAIMNMLACVTVNNEEKEDE